MSSMYVEKSSARLSPTPRRHSDEDVAVPRQHKNPEQIERFAGFGVGVASLFAENLLSHPCIVLRRQCQVHHDSQWYHLTPFTLLPIIVNIQRRQGIATLWKGIGGTFVVRGINLVTETVMSELTSFPREVTRYTTWRNLGLHVTLKGMTFAITTPFAAASLVETVQSDIASERPGMLDIVKEGTCRLLRWGTPHTTRLLPVWKFVLPTSLFFTLHYIISQTVQALVISKLRPDIDTFIEIHSSSSTTSKRSSATRPRRLHDAYLPDLIAIFSSHLIAETLLYPLETVVHRLHLQGTRTIIDNLDFGYEVVPITTCYEGMMDCVQSIVKEEGFLGFYKGFGALVLQYTVQVVVLRITKLVFDQIVEMYGSNKTSSKKNHDL